MRDYHVNLFCRDDDHGYIANIPDLRHCLAFGTTLEEALREVLITKKTWPSAAEENHLEIQEAIYSPLIYQVV